MNERWGPVLLSTLLAILGGGLTWWTVTTTTAVKTSELERRVSQLEASRASHSDVAAVAGRLDRIEQKLDRVLETGRHR